MNQYDYRLILISLIFFVLPFNSFSQSYTVLGNAVQLSGCNCYRLTQDLNGQGGAIYQDQTLDLSNSFDYTFSIFLGCRNGGGADGIMFVLTNNPNGLGASGGGMGYSGGNQPNSLAIEFDTYTNSQYGDPGYHHIGLNSGGSVSHNVLGPTPALPNAANIDDCQNHTVRIVWEVATSTYSVYFDGSLRVNHVIPNMVNTYFNGNPIVNWGWTAATGGQRNEHRVCVESTTSWIAGVDYQSCEPTIQFTDVSTSSAGNIQLWSWDFGDGTTSSDQNPIHTYSGVGTYNVSLTIVDINGCSNVFSNPVVINDSILINETITEPLCNGDSNGEILANASLGFGPSAGFGGYSYEWDNGPTTASNSGIAAGIYSVTVTDGVCSSIKEIIVTEPQILNISSSSTDVTCFGANDGSINIQISGGTQPFTFMGAPVPGNNLTMNGLSPGVYAGQIIDANGCTANASETITEPSAIQLSEIHTNVSCFEGADASITVTASGGTTPYSFEWSDMATSQNRTGLTVGSYDLTMTDINSCTETINVVITEPNEIVVQETHQDVSCFGDTDGSIQLNPSGGTGNFVYSWSPNISNNDLATQLASGSYEVSVSDQNNCEVVTLIEILEPDELLNITTLTDESCFESNDGSILLNVSGGNTPYTFDFIENNDTTQSTTGDFNNLSPGMYNFIVTDFNGCKLVFNEEIQAATLLEANSISQQMSCANSGDGIVDLQINGGAQPYSFEWSNGRQSENIDMLYPGVYSVTISDFNGCTTELSDTINEMEEIWVSTDSTVYNIKIGDSVIINSSSFTDGRDIVSYEWEPFSGGLTCSDCSSITANPIYSTEYTLSIIDANGCIADTTFEIVVDDEQVFYAPNIFTPNGDGRNDVYGISAKGVENFKLRIFDRWGNLLFVTDDINEKWDGTYKGKQLTSDVYIYSVYASFLNKSSRREKGSLTLLR